MMETVLHCPLLLVGVLLSLVKCNVHDQSVHNHSNVSFKSQLGSYVQVNDKFTIIITEQNIIAYVQSDKVIIMKIKG